MFPPARLSLSEGGGDRSMMMPPLLLLLLPLTQASPAADRLAVTCSFASGCTIHVDGAQWSASKVTKTRANGRWCSSADGTLEPKTPHPAPLAGNESLLLLPRIVHWSGVNAHLCSTEKRLSGRSR